MLIKCRQPVEWFKLDLPTPSHVSVTYSVKDIDKKGGLRILKNSCEFFGAQYYQEGYLFAKHWIAQRILFAVFYILWMDPKSVSQSTIQPVSPRGYIPTISVLEIIFTTTGRTQQKDDDDEEVQGMCGSTSGVNKLIRNFSFSHPRRIFLPPAALGSNMCPIEGCMLLLLRLLAT